jgi:hypothetical protein
MQVCIYPVEEPTLSIRLEVGGPQSPPGCSKEKETFVPVESSSLGFTASCLVSIPTEQ